MGETTAIEWTGTPRADGTLAPGATWNPWWGCVRVSPACEHCYAETFANRMGVGWGIQSRRRFFGEKHWQEPLKWDRKAAAAGERRKVFCASMADVFELLPDGHPDAEAMHDARLRLWELIGQTPSLDWLLLTKRPQFVTRFAPEGWAEAGNGWPANVWLGTTVEDQRRADERIPHLLDVPAPVRFLSCEPLLGPVDLAGALPVPVCEVCGGWRLACDAMGHRPESDRDHRMVSIGVDWVIAGGESGHGARPSHPDWFRSLRDQCQAAGVAFFFKQWGEFGPVFTDPSPVTVAGGEDVIGLGRIGKKAAGRTLDGREWSQFPEAARG